MSQGQCGCEILMRTYGFSPDFEIQYILYGKWQIPDCTVRIAVKGLYSCPVLETTV